MTYEGLDWPDYSAFMETTLKPLLQEYTSNDIYNADGISFFYKMLTNCTYAFQEQKVHWSKQFNSKDRISLMLCTNMTGTDKLAPMTIGKVARPHVIKKQVVTLSQLKVDYCNSNGWMTVAIFEYWFDKWNDKLVKQGHHILLLIDTPSHIMKEYSNIKVQFPPPNTTSKMQPLDQGVIGVCKLHYHTLTTQKFLRTLNTEDDMKEIMAGLDFIIACENIVAALNYISDRLIKSASIKQASWTASQQHQSLNKTSRITYQVLNVQVPVENYATADDNVEASERLSEADIVDTVRKWHNPDTDVEDGEDWLMMMLKF